MPIPITSLDGKNVFCSDTCEEKWQSRQSPTPTFAEFANGRFLEQMQADHAAKPKTLRYYRNSLRSLGLYKPMQNLRLNRVDADVIDGFVTWRRKAKARGKKTCVKIATINRELETLRHALHLAERWDLIRKAPKIERLSGEQGRDRVIDHSEEQAYLSVARQPLRDVATAIIDGGFRPEEITGSRWENCHFRPAGKAMYGYLHVPDGKSDYAKRNVSMTARVRALLEMRWEEQGRPKEGWVFPDADIASGHIEPDSLRKQHARALRESGVKHFVVYSLRHTALTRLGESGADCYAIQKIAGHSSILISQRYVHPTPEKIENAFTQLAEYNARKEEELKAEQEGGRVQ